MAGRCWCRRRRPVCCEVLDLVDLGEHQLKGLETPERIFQVGRGDFPALRTPRPVVGNLPVELSTFVGRSDEVTSLVDELADQRLVTLIGVGGTGKTRLAIETAATVSACRSPTGAGWWSWPPSRSRTQCRSRSLRVGCDRTAEGDVVDHLVARLHDKRCLVVVDNCEHVLAATADVVERIVAACPTVMVLATSREPLMVRGERLVPVPSLRADDAERLFLQRARNEAPDLVIDDDQRRAVTELCQRLDGLPLALELAASRVRALTPVELVANLEERFRMLVGGRRSRMERHQTMRGTLDWSYDLCSDVEQAVFDRLSVFPAGFDLSAARAVAGGDGVDEIDVVDVVPQLVDRSLLQRSTAIDGTTRYRMLETMRAYGREHLHHQGLSDTTRERHAHYMAQTIAALSLREFGPDETQVGRRLAEYLPDALVALDWFIDRQDWENGLRVMINGSDVSEREQAEMAARLHDAARVGGATIDLLDELDRRDPRGLLTESADQFSERGWRTIRARVPVSSDRFTWSPYGDLREGGLADADVEEFVASLGRWGSAPAMSRFFAVYDAIRALAYNGHLDRAEQQLSNFAPFVADLDSRRASRLLAELQGVMAMERQDWPAAAHWYRLVTEDAEGNLATSLDLVAAWRFLTARCLCAEPVSITGAELRDPWHCYQVEGLDHLQWNGAVATAIALHRLGHDELADRFVSWAFAHDNVAIMDAYAIRLEAAGLPTTEIDSEDDLETLIAEVFAVADRLDGIQP